MSSDWDSPPTGEALPVDPLDGTPPDPGTGGVWVSPVAGKWCAVWTHPAPEGMVGVRIQQTEHPTREQAVVWALAQPATEWRIYDEGKDEFAPLNGQAI